MHSSAKILFLFVLAAASSGAAPRPATMSEVLAATTPADWRPLDPENTLYLELPTGRVVIELAPRFAPLHVRAAVKVADTPAANDDAVDAAS